MTKTPEELTKDWKAGELEDGLYYILLENGKTPISELETWYRTNIEESKEYYETEQAFYGYSDNMISEVLAPVPTYDEYKAMQAAIQNGESAIDTNKRLCKTIEELEEEAQMWGVPQKVCVTIANELSPHFRLVGFWETDKNNGVIVETDDGEQRLLSHEQYKDLMKARKSKGKNNETA